MLRIILFLFLPLLFFTQSYACSIVYYVDSTSGKIYVANNEDYWYNIRDYIQLMPAKKGKNARLWYGWDDFAQGGINAAGLFFDAAVTPEQNLPEGYQEPDGRNIGDEILAYCSTVEEAVAYLEKEKIAVSSGHLFFGDSTGNAVVVEWVNGKTHTIQIEDNMLIATNYLLSDTAAGNYPCPRFQSIQDRVNKLRESQHVVDLKTFGNVIGGAVQPPIKDENGRVGGTLYTSFINITDMEFVLVPKLDNSRAIKLDLAEEFRKGRKRKIKLSD